MGRTYTAPDGTEHRPSMWLTLTLDSYGPVHAVRTSKNGKAMPCLCRRIPHRRRPAARHPGRPGRLRLPPRRVGRRALRPAARPVLAEPAPRRRLERPVRRLRRAAAPPGAARALRDPGHHPAGDAANGSRPPPTTRCGGRRPTRRSTTPDRPPVWDDEDGRLGRPGHRASRCPPGPTRSTPSTTTRTPNPRTWCGSGRRSRPRASTPARSDVDRTIGYITKYVTKDAADCHQVTTDPQRAHLDRLWHELRVTPCSDRCANWLLYGIAPEEGARQAASRRLQGPGPPAGHPRHRRAPRPRLPRLVRQDPRRPPRRRPRLGPRPPRHLRRPRPGRPGPGPR